MNRLRVFGIVALALLILLIATGAVAWWYFFGVTTVDAAELVPADTVAFASIPNGMVIAAGYQTSQLKTLVDAPNAQPLIDQIHKLIGEKNLEVLNSFWPNLNGQSFIAITHVDPDKLANIGFIAGMKPRPGLGNFSAFVEKLKATYPDEIKQGTTGTGSVDGVDYQWIQGPGASDKICVAQYRGWIITSWGEAALQDWAERFKKTSGTPSLAQDPDYVKSLGRVGKDPMTLVYLNYHAIADLLQKQMAKTNPASGDYFAKKLGGFGGMMMATRFDNGEIRDSFSALIPAQAQTDAGMNQSPCAFESLGFTGPDTRLYWASSFNAKQVWKNLQEHSDQAGVNSMGAYLVPALKAWAQGAGLDVEHNIIDPLGGEISFQVNWTDDMTYPDAGLFVKLDKPDDFKPVITAIIDQVRTRYITSAEVNEVNSGGHNYATLKFVQNTPISPTITEDGPYFGVFLTENQAVLSFQRDETLDLAHNPDFNRQVGDNRNGASQILYLDTPYAANRTYRTVMPYLSVLSMFNKHLAASIRGLDLPPDLTWLAPVGTWSFVAYHDDDGMKAYSVSGVGNQGLFLGAGLGASVAVAQQAGLFPKSLLSGSTAAPGPQGGTAPAPDQASADNGPQSILTVAADGSIAFDGTAVTADQLGDFLKNKKAADENLKVTVKEDKNAPAAVISQVLAAGASGGLGVLPVLPLDATPPPASTNAAPAIAPTAAPAATPPSPTTNSNATPPAAPAPTQ